MRMHVIVITQSHVIQSACNKNIVSSILTSFRCVFPRRYRTNTSTECYFWKEKGEGRQRGEPVLTETGDIRKALLYPSINKQF